MLDEKLENIRRPIESHTHKNRGEGNLISSVDITERIKGLENKYPNLLETILDTSDGCVHRLLRILDQPNVSNEDTIIIVGLLYEKNHSRNATYDYDITLIRLNEKLNRSFHKKPTDTEMSLLTYLGSSLFDSLPTLVERHHDSYIIRHISELILDHPQTQEIFFPSLLKISEINKDKFNIIFEDIIPCLSFPFNFSLATQIIESWNSLTEIFFIDELVKILVTSIPYNIPPKLDDKSLESLNNFFIALRRKINIADFYGYGDNIRILLDNLRSTVKYADDLLEIYPELQKHETKPTSYENKDENDEITYFENEKAFLYSFVSDLSNNKSREILNSIESLLDSDPKLKDAFINLIKGRPSSGMGSYKISDTYSHEVLSKVLTTDTIIELINIMLNNPKKFRFQLGALLSLVPVSKVNTKCIEKIQPIMSDLDLKIKPDNEGWFLCSDSEKRLLESMIKQLVLVVNGVLLVKFIGKPAALCLRNYSSKNGYIFIEGNWYALTDYKTNYSIREAFCRGDSRILLDSGEWALMRPIENFSEKKPDELIQLARKYVDLLDEKLPLTYNGLSRSEIREELNESHD